MYIYIYINTIYTAILINARTCTYAFRYNVIN